MLEQQEQAEALDPKTSITEKEVQDLVKLAEELDAALPNELQFNIDDQGPWSMSKLKALQKCPFQYYLKYIAKFKLPRHYQIQDDPVSANLGKAAHEILESVMIGSKVDSAYKKVKQIYVGTKILTEDQWKNGVDSLEYSISRFAERIESFARENPIKRVLTELRIGVTRNYEPTGFFSDDVWLRGVVDLVLMLACKDVLIFDHKKGGGQGGVRNYTEQLDLYKLLFHCGIEPVLGAQSGINFIEAGSVDMAGYSTAKEIETDIRSKFEWNLQGALDKTKETGYFKHIRGSLCKYCEYDKAGCKSGAMKPLELKTKRFFEIKKV